MPPRKREPSSSEDESHGGSEEVLDPKLAQKGDVDDEELNQPARKKSKKEAASSPAKPASGGSEKKSGKGKYAGTSVFNPGLPSSTTPLQDLKNALKEQGKNSKSSGNVIYWQRNKDLRISDNRALSIASDQAVKNGGALIALHVLSPEDFRAHDRSARRVDFILRNLREMQADFDKAHIPFVVLTHEPRATLVDKVLELAGEWSASAIFGNIEYEVDELWRDAKLVREAKKRGGDVHASFVDDCYVVPPGSVSTKEGRQYSVFTPWCRSWTNYISQNLDILEPFEDPAPNAKSVREDAKLGKLFDGKIPASVEGFECKDSDYMSKLWPAGEKAAALVLDNFFQGKGGLKMLEEPATAENTPHVKDAKSTKKGEESRIARYAVGRNLMNENGTSHISPYLAAGICSARECMRRVKKLQNNRLNVGRDSGPAMWATECAFRDFYGHVLAAWPRVCMGRAYVLRYEEVVWEEDAEMLKKWQEGRTGYPIVDASMRQCAKQGYMHNRGRMMAAMFLTKHLMQDWRHGERWFMQNFIDGDFASNNVRRSALPRRGDCHMC